MPARISAVHPRVGGERPGETRGFASFSGSSPRGRGTHSEIRGGRIPLRFIPAWAGNADDTLIPSAEPSVHPRVGGERQKIIEKIGTESGSSPRGRGTRRDTPGRSRLRRFIPAWAGNAYRYRRRPVGCTVHPRVGGERRTRSVFPSQARGSSPRGRGTRGGPGGAASSDRFIPAWAGNALPSLRPGPGESVHPRVGGERSCWKALIENTIYDVKERTKSSAYVPYGGKPLSEAGAGVKRTSLRPSRSAGTRRLTPHVSKS